VRALDLGPLNTGAQQLQGPLSPALAGLTQLVLLDLSQNALTGAVPAQLAALAQLQLLGLNGNRLSGPLPAFLGGLPSLKGVHLEGNDMSGPLPQDWCANNASYTVTGNPVLCGERCQSRVLLWPATRHAGANPEAVHVPVPPTADRPSPYTPQSEPAGIVPACLEARGVAGVGALAGTYLLPGGDLSLGTGGYCDSTPPQCDFEVGCRCVGDACGPVRLDRPPLL
jgi:hypothetical protein